MTIVLLCLFLTRLAYCGEPSVATLDADARAEGNRKDIADRIGDVLFARPWPMQVLRVEADSIDHHVVVGLRLSGVKFHKTLDREEFIVKVAELVSKTYSAYSAQEVDVWAVVPMTVGKGVIVTGDLAKPTSRTVFSLTVSPGESATSMMQRMRAGAGVYWDEEWAHTLVNKKG